MGPGTSTRRYGDYEVISLKMAILAKIPPQALCFLFFNLVHVVLLYALFFFLPCIITLPHLELCRRVSAAAVHGHSRNSPRRFVSLHSFRVTAVERQIVYLLNLIHVVRVGLGVRSCAAKRNCLYRFIFFFFCRTNEVAAAKFHVKWYNVNKAPDSIVFFPLKLDSHGALLPANSQQRRRAPQLPPGFFLPHERCRN